MSNNIIQTKLNDGQLSESPLTLKDLKTIASALSKNLRAAHHQRIKYHENIIQELEEYKIKLDKFQNDAFISIATSCNQIFEAERISAAFEKNHIDHMLLKGTLLKEIYTHKMKTNFVL